MIVNPAGDVIVPFKKAKIVKLMLMGLVMAAASITICFIPNGATPYPSWALRVVGVVGVAFFGLGSLVYVAHFFSRRPARMVGSPISLAATSLDAKFDEIAALIERSRQQPARTV